MATDILKVLQEIRGTGAPEAPYTDGIYWDLTQKLHNGNAGKYGDIIAMYSAVLAQSSQVNTWYTSLATIHDNIVALEASATSAADSADVSALNASNSAAEASNAVNTILTAVDNVVTGVHEFTNKLMNSMTNYIGANHIHHPIRNTSGALIPAGTVVTAQDLQSGTDYIEVIPVSSANTQIALGITQVDIAQNGVGLITNTGEMEGIIDTSAWPVGTILYPNGIGGLSDVKPINGHYQACAMVTRSDTLQGILLIEFTKPTLIASTTQAGIVQLNDTLTSTSVTEAATANAVKQLEDKKADRTELHSSYLIGSKMVDEAAIADGNILIYDAVADKLVYSDTLSFGTI